MRLPRLRFVDVQHAPLAAHRVWVFGFSVEVLDRGCGVWVSGLRVGVWRWGMGFEIESSSFWIEGAGCVRLLCLSFDDVLHAPLAAH